MRAQWLSEKELITEIREKKELSKASARPRARERTADYEQPRGCNTARSRRRNGGDEAQQKLAEVQTRRLVPQGGGHRRGHRRGRRQVDRHPREQDARGREGQAPSDGGASARARDRPGRGRRRRVQRGAALARRAAASRTGRSARSCSSGPPVSARPSSRARWPTSCSTTTRR